VKLLTNRQIRVKNKFVILFIVLVILVSLPLIVKGSYLQHLFIMVLITSVLGMTFSMIFCCTGMVTLGIGAFYGIGAYACAILVMKLDLSFWLALPLAVMITGIIALGFGLLTIRNPGIPFVLLTMCFVQIIEQITGQLEFFGGWGGFMMIPRPDPIGPIEFTTKLPYYYLMLFLFLLVVLIFQALYTSRIGRVWKAISLSPGLAQTLGINVYRYRVLAFVIASCAAGLVGSFYAHYLQLVAPATFGGFFSILIQLYAILGGIHFYILGPTLGAIILTFFPEFLRITEGIEPLITGALLLIIVIFFPTGILGTLQKSPRLGLARISDRLKEIRAWLSYMGPKR